MTERLVDMINLGPTTADWLAAVGIETPARLRALGSVEAWRRLRAARSRPVTRNALYALEGALAGLRWNQLPRARRAELDAAWRRLCQEMP